MKKIMKKASLLLITLVLLISMVSPSVAWFAKYIDANFSRVGGSSAVAYFASGTGSEGDPYMIAAPVHLYNLAWLQYIGYFNLGTINNGRGQNFFKLQNNIDMQGLAIPPIGTTEYPFLGNFDGNSKIISNFTTANAALLLPQRPTNAQFKATNDLLTEFGGNSNEAGAIMGFFGVVGDYNGAVAKVSAKDSTFDPAKTGIKNAGLNNYELNCGSSATTIGMVAGYVNAKVENMLINNAKLNTVSAATAISEVTTKISDHTLVGYATDTYKGTISAYEVNVSSPSFSEYKDINGVGGLDANWGGSVAMSTLYDNLSAVRDSGSVGMPDYAYQAVKVMSADGSSFCAVERVTTGWLHTDSAGLKEQYSVLFLDGTLSLDEFFMLGGGAMVSTVVCNETTAEVDAQYIKYGDSYLNVALGGGSPTITLGTDQATATKWAFDGGSLFVLTGGIKLFLNVSSQKIEFSYKKETTSGWSYVEDKGLCYTNGTTDYYLKLVNNEWVLREEANTAAYYVIKSGDNYLCVSESKHQSGYNLATNYYTTDPNDPNIARWYYEPNEGGTTYSVYTAVVTTPKCVLHMLDVFVLNPDAFGYIRWEIADGHLNLLDNPPGYVAFIGGSWVINSDVNNAADFLAVTPSADDSESLAWSKVDTTGQDMQYDLSSVDDYSNFEYGVANKYDATYVALQTNDDGTPTASNTGYITSGMYNQLNSNPANGPQQPQQNTGDVRMSSFFDENIEHPNVVYAWDQTSGTFKEISTDTSTFEDGSFGASLRKYETSVVEYTELISAERLYGIQFTDGKISTDSLITIPEAKINGETLKNYEVPGDCINFKLKQKGYINFFAATYYPGTNCFFSLHHIIRDANKKITAIKEISVIYEVSGSGAYVYGYNGGGYSVDGFSPSGATVVFNTSCLTSPEGIKAQENMQFESSDISGFRGEGYYFEIPVNADEFALGSVSERTGACLLYLDIGASMQDAPAIVDRTKIEEVIVEGENTYEYALGVSMMNGTTYAAIGDNYLSLSLPVGYGTSIELSRTDSNGAGVITPTLSGDGSGAVLNAVGGILSVTGMSMSPAQSGGITTKRVTYLDYDNNNAEMTIAIITFKDSNRNGVVDSGEITAKDGEGNDILAVIGLSTTNNISSFVLPTKPAGDTIEWSNISASTTPVITYSYEAKEGDTVTMSIEYSNTNKTYTVTIESGEEMPVTVTDLNTNDAVTSVTINGTTVSEGTTVGSATG